MKTIIFIILLFFIYNLCFGQEITKENWNDFFGRCYVWKEKIVYNGNEENHKLIFCYDIELDYDKYLSVLKTIFNDVYAYNKELDTYDFLGENYYASIPIKYRKNDCMYIGYYCEDCYDYIEEVFKLKYIDKKQK